MPTRHRTPEGFSGNEPDRKQEQLDPKQHRNLMMAAELSIRIGDNDNATKIYKDIGREDLIPNAKTHRTTEGADLKIQTTFERLMRKVVRWLTAKEQWQKQRKHTDTHIETGMFDLHNEPEYKELGQIDVAKMLGTFPTQLSKLTDNPYEPEHIGIPLASYQDEILWLHNGIVSLVDRKRASPVIPKDI